VIVVGLGACTNTDFPCAPFDRLRVYMGLEAWKGGACGHEEAIMVG